MNKPCRVCGKPIIGKRRRAIYCGDTCRRAAYNARANLGSPHDDEDTEEGRLEVARRLAAASYVVRRCRCSSPLGLVDEDGRATCFRCGWPLEREVVGALPPAA